MVNWVFLLDNLSSFTLCSWFDMLGLDVDALDDDLTSFQIYLGDSTYSAAIAAGNDLDKVSQLYMYLDAFHISIFIERIVLPFLSWALFFVGGEDRRRCERVGMDGCGERQGGCGEMGGMG